MASKTALKRIGTYPMICGTRSGRFTGRRTGPALRDAQVAYSVISNGILNVLRTG
jgi:hypothetical protein